MFTAQVDFRELGVNERSDALMGNFLLDINNLGGSTV